MDLLAGIIPEICDKYPDVNFIIGMYIIMCVWCCVLSQYFGNMVYTHEIMNCSSVLLKNKEEKCMTAVLQLIKINTKFLMLYMMATLVI